MQWVNLYRYLHEFNMYSVALRLLLAMLFGGIIGIERGSKRRAAGFRTYMLVCVGSALVMITNQYLAINYATDPARLGAQVVSGIGFLGAGTIIVTTHNQIKGLTTAAGLWASACLGLAVGIGFYEGAIIASVLIFFIIALMGKVDRKIVSNAKSMDIYVELGENGKLSELLSLAHNNGIRVLNVEFVQSRMNNAEPFAALISLHLPKRRLHDDVLSRFANIDGVSFIEEI